MAISQQKRIERLENLSCACIGDVMDMMGYSNQALSSDIKPLEPNMKVAGPIFTIYGKTYEPGLETKITNFHRLFDEISDGEVVMMATNGHNVSGPWGENTSISARKPGARGYITDGGTRDAKGIVELGFPTFCKFISPVFALNRFINIDIQQSVVMPGIVEEKVVINPGDYVFADRDGIVIIPKDIVDEVIVAAERLEEIESDIKRELLEGKDRFEVYQRHPKFDHIKKIK